MKVRFKREKETKHTVRYKEMPEHGKATVIGTIYLQKWFAGETEEILITIDKNASASNLKKGRFRI